jgi:hypothetical protein
VAGPEPALDLAQVADELYGLSPDDFRPARDERASQARAAGDKDLARAITALRRPVVSAWLVNLLAREAGGQMSELVALGGSLRDAQQALDGDRLRELSGQRRQLVAAMVGEAKQLAAREGRPVSLQVEREVEATLQAALADPQAAAAVRAGQLASPLSYAGLGAGEVATAGTGGRAGKGATSSAAGTEQEAKRKVPRERAAQAERAPGPATPGGGRPKARGMTAAERAEREAAQREAREAAAAERREREASAARQAVEDAASAEAAARATLDDAERTAAQARAIQDEIRQRAERLDRELAEALAEQSRAARTVREAQLGREAAARALDAATKRLARARQAASRLG